MVAEDTPKTPRDSSKCASDTGWMDRSSQSAHGVFFFAYVFFFFFFFPVFSKDEIHTQSLGATHAATKTRYLKM